MPIIIPQRKSILDLFNNNNNESNIIINDKRLSRHFSDGHLSTDYEKNIPKIKIPNDNIDDEKKSSSSSIWERFSLDTRKSIDSRLSIKTSPTTTSTIKRNNNNGKRRSLFQFTSPTTSIKSTISTKKSFINDDNNNKTSFGGIFTKSIKEDDNNNIIIENADEKLLILPIREEGETSTKYLEKLYSSTISSNLIAGILSKTNDIFFQQVLRSYTRRFSFFGEPIDMSLRKFLLEVELPKETQQVDRVIQSFSNRYNECNPGIFFSSGKFLLRKL